MDPHLRTAVDASLAWYADVFALHEIPTLLDGGLWRSLAEPPPLHSAAKTLEPAVAATDVLGALAAYPTSSVADSFGELDLEAEGFELLFEATWLHHAPLDPRPMPEGWSRVVDPAGLDAWVALHGTEGIFLLGILERPEFALMAHHVEGALTGGAVVHESRSAVSLSNFSGDATYDDVLTVAAALHPGRPITDYAHGQALDDAVAARFTPLGPQCVWLRSG